YFNALDALYPFSANSEQALRDMIYADYKNRDYPAAQAAAERFIRLYPRSNFIDYAYYMKGMSEVYETRTFLQSLFPLNLAARDLNAPKQAFFDFRDLVQMFPDSKYAPDAHQQMIYLRNMFAEHELEVAMYYFKRSAYVAAANRASYLITHYEGTPQVEPA